MKIEQQSPAADTQSTRQIVFSVNILVPVGGFEDSRFIKAGEPSPYRDISEVPEQLRAFIEPAEPLETAESDERFANFQENVVYRMNPDGSRSHNRAISRQAASREFSRDVRGSQSATWQPRIAFADASRIRERCAGVP